MKWIYGELYMYGFSWFRKFQQPWYLQKRQLQATHLKLYFTFQPWNVEQRRFLGWYLRRPPYVDSFYDFVVEFLKLVDKTPTGKTYGPPVIHCG